MKLFRRHQKWVLLVLLGVLTVTGGAASTLTGCGPFGDTSGPQCTFILELYYLGIAGGTSATTFDPGANVTRGQVAVFMGAGLNYLRRVANADRVGARQNLNIFNAIYENFKSANTSHPIGFCTDGFFSYVSNQDNAKIDVYQRGAGNGLAGSYTLTNPINRLACNATYIYATSAYGNTIARVNKHTAAIDDPWVTLPVGGTGDIAVAGFTMAVTTNDGIMILNNNGTIPSGGHVVLNGGTFTYSVVVDKDGNYWAATNNKLIKVDQGGNVITTATLNGNCNYYSVNDGVNTWVPVSNGYDIVSTGGVVVDHKPFVFAGASFATGGGFNGQYVFFAESGTFSCGSGTGALVIAFDAANHNAVQAIGMFCGEFAPYVMGWDGQNLHVATYVGDNHYIF